MSIPSLSLLFWGATLMCLALMVDSTVDLTALSILLGE